MPQPNEPLILGEFRRAIDERFRLSIPAELLEPLAEGGHACVLAKERPGSLSLWNATTWGDRLDDSVRVVQSKLQGRRLESRTEELQLLGRLLSTRHREVQVAGRGRLLIPEGFREFLGVEPGGEVMVIGAAVCVEIWNPHEWISHLREKIPEFGKLLNDLVG
jgi:MraZ protein